MFLRLLLDPGRAGAPPPRPRHRPGRALRGLLAGLAALAALGPAPGAAATPAAAAEPPPLRVGLMLPYTGTYASLGAAIENGFRLRLEELGGRLGGRPVEVLRVDDESDPARATAHVNQLIRRDRAEVLVGSVHSGVAMAMAHAARTGPTLLIVPNAGANALTGPLCAPYLFRTSFSSWQSAYVMGEVAARRGGRRAATITWKYAAGDEMAAAFVEGFERGGGKVVRGLTLPFPQVEFQPLLTEIAGLKPDVVFAFFSGPSAVKFVKEFAAAGLKRSIALVGPGFLTEGTLAAQGEAAEGLLTALHYADGLDTPRDRAFRASYERRHRAAPDVYAVQGYDAAQVLAIGLQATGGDPTRLEAFGRAVRAATIDSPRGAFTLSAAHNPVQDIYLRRVEGGRNVMVEVAARALADPARGCRP